MLPPKASPSLRTPSHLCALCVLPGRGHLADPGHGKTLSASASNSAPTRAGCGFSFPNSAICNPKSQTPPLRPWRSLRETQFRFFPSPMRSQPPPRFLFSPNSAICNPKSAIPSPRARPLRPLPCTRPATPFGPFSKPREQRLLPFRCESYIHFPPSKRPEKARFFASPCFFRDYLPGNFLLGSRSPPPTSGSVNDPANQTPLPSFEKLLLAIEAQWYKLFMGRGGQSGFSRPQGAGKPFGIPAG